MNRNAWSLLVGIGTLLLVAHWAGASATFFHQDDFSSYPKDSDGSPNWETVGISWTAGDGKFECVDRGKDFAFVAGSPWGELGYFEVTLVLKETVVSDWKVAGLGFYVDKDHYWQFALVEQPDDKGNKHFVELAQMFGGTWNAQSSGVTALQTAESIGHDFRWNYGTPYRMRIEWNDNSVRGTVLDSRGVLLSRTSYRYGFQPVCRVGKPMLVSGGFRAQFSDVQARISGREDFVMAQPTPFPEYSMKGYRRVQGERTGYFHVQKRDGRWWVIDPKGLGFYMVGTDHCNYRVHWCEKLGYAPYHKFVSEKYPSEDAWAANATKRLLSWNFNSLGANNSPSTRYRGLAHTEFLSLGAGFVNHDDICPRTTWTGFPNVFHPRFREFCQKQAKQRCAPNKNDPWLLGYFIDNELEWFGKSHKPWGLCDEVFKKPAEHSAKKAFVEFVRERHSSIADFNAAWGTALGSFEAILDLQEPLFTDTEQGIEDKMDFVRLIAEKYFEITTSSIREHDPNHMILGTRFAGQNPSIWDICGKYCDIVSVNCYRNVDLETEEFTDGFPEDLLKWYEECERPLMITEWSYPALDAGLPCKYGAGQRVDTQEQRAKAFGIFQRKVFSTPFLVGSMFFMWVDEPALGISSTFPEDSNYGLVNEKDEAYPELTKMATRLNKAVYDLHDDRTPRLRAQLRSDGTVEIENVGGADARTSLTVHVNGSRSKRAVRVKAGGSQRVSLELPAEPGGVFALVEVDPSRQLIEPDSSGHRAQLVDYNPGLAALHGLQGAWVPVVVANGKRESVRDVVLSLPIAEFVSSEGREPTVLSPVGGSLVAVAAQWDEELKELSIRMDEIGAKGIRVFLVGLDETVSPETFAGAVRIERQDDGKMLIENGRLTLEHDSTGAIFDRVSLDGLTLGSFKALLHLHCGEDMWISPDRVEQVIVSSGPVRSVIRFVMSYSGTSEHFIRRHDADKLGVLPLKFLRPGAFRTAYQVEIVPERSWFASKFLWVENTDEQPLDLREYFYYAQSSIGGSSADDEVSQGFSAPNRYGTCASWFDPKHQTHYGVVVPSRSGLSVSYWVDDDGGQHPDLRKKVEAVLAPGQRYEESAAAIYVFGLKDDGDTSRLKETWQEIAGSHDLHVHVFSEP